MKLLTTLFALLLFISPVSYATPEFFSGTGFLVSSDGVIMTARHVIDGASAIRVIYHGQVYTGVVISQDEDSDIALIRISVNTPTDYIHVVIPSPKAPVVLVGFDRGEPPIKTHSGEFNPQNDAYGFKAVTSNLCSGDSGGPAIVSESNELDAAGVIHSRSIAPGHELNKDCSSDGWVSPATGMLQIMDKAGIKQDLSKPSVLDIVFIETEVD